MHCDAVFKSKMYNIYIELFSIAIVSKGSGHCDSHIFEQPQALTIHSFSR